MASKKKAAAKKPLKRRTVTIPKKNKAATARTQSFSDRNIPAGDEGLMRISIVTLGGEKMAKVVDMTDTVGSPTVDFLPFDEFYPLLVSKNNSGDTVISTSKTPGSITSYYTQLPIDPVTMIGENGVLKVTTTDTNQTYNLPMDLVINWAWDASSSSIAIGLVHQDDIDMYLVKKTK